jgi:hypothetical protein
MRTSGPGRQADRRKAFRGAWRITRSEVWGQGALDLVQPAFLRFSEDILGDFGMIAVAGGLHCYYGEREGKPLVEFTWEGEDDGNPRCGRGWATLEADGSLVGRLFIHLGDDSAFTAVREEPVGQGTRKPRQRVRR